MSSINEQYKKYIIPFGTNRILNMPYACDNSQKCSPYKVNLFPGQYKIEFWGGSGGDTASFETKKLIHGGLGGYVKGVLKTDNPLSLFFYVGAKGYAASSTSYNGGGRGPLIETPFQEQGAGGGGSSDVRLVPLPDDDGDETPSLKTRLMVAGAGGGACSYIKGARGGNNLGLEGESGILVVYDESKDQVAPPTGGTQKQPGRGFRRPNGYFGESGSLGKGGGFPPKYATGAGAGGGGLFGGGCGSWSDGIVSSGAGGSSFVNGCSKCANVSGLLKLTDIKILGGNQVMPSPMGVEEQGHYGNGFARITALSGSFEDTPSCRRRKGRMTNIILFIFLL